MRERPDARRRGICLRDLPGHSAPTDAGFDLIAAIAAAANAGADILHLPTVRAASASLDPADLAGIRAAATDAGIALTVGLPPAHPDRRDRVWGTDADAPSHPMAQLRAAGRLGAASVHVTVGQDEDRFRIQPSWTDQLERVVPVLAELVGASPCPVVLKTHEEMTTWEALDLCDAVPGLRLGFSPVNVVARLEDPQRAAIRVASRVHTIFVDDCSVYRGPAGLMRAMRAIGSGDLPWSAMLAVLPDDAPLVIDLHRATLGMPLYDEEWLARQPDLTPDELAILYGSTRPEPATADDLPLRTATALALLAA